MKRRKTRLGRVVSDKMDKTVVVAVEWRRRHPIYKKAVRRITKFKAHDEKNECRVGDLVMIEETRPLSREKRWRIKEILARGVQVEVKPEEIGAELEQPQAIAPQEAPPSEKAEAKEHAVPILPTEVAEEEPKQEKEQ